MSRALIFVGVFGVALVWGVVSWIRAHGFLDFFALTFILLGVIGLSWFTFSIVRGASHG